MPRIFWESNLEAMRDVYLPMAETTLCMADGKVVGFLSMVEETVACLFIEPSWQGKGAGRFLMDVAKASQPRLTLSVYKENEQARRFYEQSGFRITLEQQDAHTGHPELIMEWAAN
ncbi:GNAT family N-acetyltransferase [Rhodobacteraceae bacterium RKSG542]|nr:GNAT family N-acetyltransferase [Pseudovibrio flavus]